MVKLLWQALTPHHHQVSRRHVSREVSQEIHEKAAPFVTWLRTAEEESSDSDAGESGDEVEVVYSSQQAAPSLHTEETAAQVLVHVCAVVRT